MALAKYFRFPFALAGDKTAVPDDSQPTGSVSYEDGFGPDYELDPAVDPAAKDVPRDETNQLFYDITVAIKEYQEFGVPDYIEAAQNGGSPFSYARYARVKWTDGAVYESRINANTDDPSVAASWRKVTDNLDYLAIATTAFNASVVDGEAVYWTGTEFDEAVADGTAKQNVVGFADVTNGRVFVAGLYAGKLSGLTGGTAYYLSSVTPGALTSAQTAVKVGVAKSATDLLIDIQSGSSAQSGDVKWYAANAAPTGWLKANGAAVSRTTYATLFAVIGTTFGVGDGSTTFNLPDLRGEFIRGWDDGRGVDSGRVFGSAQADELEAHNHNLSNGGTSVLTASGSGRTLTGLAAGSSVNGGAAIANTGGTETRPRNVALLACIKY